MCILLTAHLIRFFSNRTPLEPFTNLRQGLGSELSCFQACWLNKMTATWVIDSASLYLSRRRRSINYGAVAVRMHRNFHWDSACCYSSPFYYLFVIKKRLFFFFYETAQLIDSGGGGKQALICLLEMISTEGDYLSFVCAWQTKALCIRMHECECVDLICVCTRLYLQQRSTNVISNIIIECKSSSRFCVEVFSPPEWLFGTAWPFL